MKKTEPRPRIVLPSLVWLLLAVASFVAAFGVWQSQRLERLRPPAIVPPTPAPSAPGAATGTPPLNPPALVAPAGAAPGVTVAQDPAASAPLRQLDPQAGRQVLRCVSKGRVTYRDLNAGCPEGAAERVTVYPTEGVGRPQ